MHSKSLFAFSLMELMIVVAIIAILVGAAIPSYRSYIKRAHYSSIVQAALPYKTGIEECYQTTATLSDCQAGTNGIPAAVSSGEGKGLVDTISVIDGVINIVPLDKNGIIAADNYLLTPSISNNLLNWTVGGGALSAGLVK